MILTNPNVLSFSFGIYNYTNAIWNSHTVLILSGRVHEHFIFSHDSFKHPGDQEMNSKAIVVKDVLKYLQYFMSYLLSLQMLSSESERMR